MAFKVGQKVVCTGAFKMYDYEINAGAKSPVPNEVYTIRDIDCIKDGTYIRLVEIINPKFNYSRGFMECRFNAKKFKPLDYDFVEEVIKQVTPKEVEA